jgi:hypothetical protein
MKVDPVSIQAYQQVNRQDRNALGGTEQPARQTGTEQIAIEPRKDSMSSKLAIKATAADHSDMLTSEEREALELLFANYRDSSRFGSAYQARNGQESSEAAVGRLIDVKV